MSTHLHINSVPTDLVLLAKAAIYERPANRSDAVSCTAERTPHQLHSQGQNFLRYTLVE